MELFAPWHPACAEYFRDYVEGRYDERAYLWFILKREDVAIDPRYEALIVGHAGGDGIVFCFRAGIAGIWALHPIEARWQLLAPTLEMLEQGWRDGAITV